MVEIAAIPSTAARNAVSFAFDGLLKPLTFRTNCSEAARISSSVTGGAKLKRVLIFRHISVASVYWGRDASSSLRDNLRELEKIAPRITEKGESAADDGEVEWLGNNRDPTAT